MCDIDGIEIEKSSEHLIGVDFEFESWHLSFVSVLLKGFVEIAGEVVHDDVEILFIHFVGEEAVSDFEGVGVIEVFKDLKFSILVFFVLENFFYGDDLECFFISGLVDNSKSAIADFIFEGVSMDSGHLLCLFILFVFVFAVEGDGGLVFLVMKYFVDC